jgi:CHRD domain
MKWIKLTALSLTLFMSVSSLVSCEPDEELKKTTDYSKTGITLTGAQEAPAVPSSALGTMDVFYSKASRTLSYTVNWSGLSDSVLLMHIHGLAPTGFAAGVVQNIVTASNGIFPQKTSGKYTFAKTGKLSGTLLVDGLAVKEENLLNGQYYMNIHTSVYPGGEIRGQIRFQ